MKKKLMLIVPMLHQGGFERVCITTARLMEPYFDVTIIIFNDKNIAYDVSGLNIINIDMGVRKGKLQKLINILKRAKRVKELKNEIQPDIAYSFGPTANLVNTLSGSKKQREKTKVWIGLRNYTDVEEVKKIKLFKNRNDLTICCSRDIEQIMKKNYHYQNTATLYNLYDLDKIKKEADSREPELPWKDEPEGTVYLVSMGRDDEIKGFDQMVKVFSLIHEQAPYTRLIILGAGNFEKYKLLAKQLKLEAAVYFAGMQKEPYKYLKKGSIYLLTSRNEGFPNALVEGMSLGLIPVAVNCKTGPSEILTEHFDNLSFTRLKDGGYVEILWARYGVLVPEVKGPLNLDPEDITEAQHDMATAVLRILGEPELQAKYKEAAIKRAGDFTYAAYVEQFMMLVNQQFN